MTKEDVEAIVRESIRQSRENEEAENKSSLSVQENKAHEVKAEDESLLKSEALVDAALAALGHCKPKVDANVDEPELTEEEKARRIKDYAAQVLSANRKASEIAGLLTDKDREYYRKKDQEDNLDKLLNKNKK